ncbi:hypothetical protein AMES_5583 [Amycolatopsis mediterranei S699]|uniref:Gram-positive cocci surface proteins LPxTG domain-containing protein n=1 Tax=Amycolatopsis mediterranei (strain U-32) TaxID=749927 RepID=A0A0H3DBF0_AMYMU|nr:hypothetical protein [Amycolatopsis mediterranei]ADJ47408.1 hypothetical protein AMED_5656 [Amycolatopsis mediterranei U32]AFO79119.1 hypothetical protein AMES_5583 [Amycolatopsis mediterranei S699]AGT86247.1 hypothetical protein B737_5583 [Amycolatopsis mediterranei RB]KDO12404.1 hypothetical protein DV26_01745 [Amycolatopsis mediterranei]KDU88473.1 hypothetical protein DV36_29540 [Amycolatopsis mediterranei]
MRKRQLAAAVGSVAAAASVVVALVTSSSASAALPPPGSLGTLTIEPATGTAATAPVVRTSQGCTPDSDSYIAHVFGPGGFADGLVATFGLQDVNFSTTQAFPVQFTKSMTDIATDNNTTVAAGTYVVRVSCVDSFSQTTTGTFTTNMYFTDPGHYQANDPSGVPPTTTSTTKTSVSTSQPPTTTGTSFPATTTSTSDTATSASSLTSTTMSTSDSTAETVPAGDGSGGTGAGAAQSVGTSVPQRTLANTGVNAGYLLLLAVVLLGTGGVALIITRRRRAARWPSK